MNELFNGFPRGDYHELNLDWILQEVAAMKAQIAALPTGEKMPRKYILLSDSYGGTPSTNENWQTNLIAMTGITAYRQSLGGASFGGAFQYITPLQNIVDSLPDPAVITDIILLGGFNEVESLNQMQAGMTAFNAYMHEKLPNAHLHLGMIGFSTVGSRRETMYESVVERYRDVAATIKNSNYITDSEYLLVDYRHLADDNVHPNTEGAKDIARGIAAYISCGSVSLMARSDTASSVVESETFGNGTLKATQCGSVTMVQLAAKSYSLSKNWIGSTTLGTIAVPSYFKGALGDLAGTHTVAYCMKDDNVTIVTVPVTVYFTDGEVKMSMAFSSGDYKLVQLPQINFAIPTVLA